MTSCGSRDAAANASGFQIKENSTKALGRAFAGSAAAAGDASVVSNNPAAMSTFKQSAVQADVAVIDWIIPRAEFHQYLQALVTAGLGWWLVKRMPALRPDQLPQLWEADRTLMLAVGGAAAGLLLLLSYVLIGSPWPLVAAIGVTAVAEVVLFTRRFG